LSWSVFLLTSIIVLIGALLQGSIGFGLGPFAVPLLILVNPVYAPAPILIVALLLTGLMYRRERNHVDFLAVKWATVGRICGSVLGAALLVIIPDTMLKLLFGTMLLAAVLFSVPKVNLKVSPPNIFGMATISGFMATTASIGGAPMALLFQNRKGPQIRATLSVIFMIGCVISLILLTIIGRVTIIEIQAALALFPGILLGFFISKYTAKILDRGFIKPAILIVCVSAALFLILSYFA